MFSLIAVQSLTLSNKKNSDQYTVCSVEGSGEPGRRADVPAVQHVQNTRYDK